MQCEGMFKFRSITHVNAGSFTNKDGEIVNYGESYKLKVDEATPQGLFERTFKIASDSVLIPELMKYGVYQDLHLIFDVLIYSSGCRVVPVGIVKDRPEEKQRNN